MPAFTRRAIQRISRVRPSVDVSGGDNGMADQLARLTGISWRHFVRWFVLGRVFRLAIQARTLFLASSGVLLTIFGWWLLAQVFSGTDDAQLKDYLLKSYESCPWTEKKDPFAAPGLWNGLTSSARMGDKPTDAMIDPWNRLSRPVRELFPISRTFTGALFLFLAAVWAAKVWGLFGGAITRSALVQLTREEPASLGSVSRYAGKRWLSYFAAPLLPLGGVFLVTLALLTLGLLMRWSILFAGIVWPLALVGGIVMAVLLIGLMFAWPLMNAAVSAEGSDSFDALSRSYSYVFQRPLHYLFYATAAAILGLIGLVLVDLFAEWTQWLTAWSVSWGSGSKLMQDVLDGHTAGYGEHDRWGMSMLNIWSGCIRLVVIGYAFGFFWTAISAIYLLLRHDTDGAEIGEIHLDESPEAFGLPTLVKDAAGVPTVPPTAELAPTTTLPKATPVAEPPKPTSPTATPVNTSPTATPAPSAPESELLIAKMTFSELPIPKPPAAGKLPDVAPPASDTAAIRRTVADLPTIQQTMILPTPSESSVSDSTADDSTKCDTSAADAPATEPPPPPVSPSDPGAPPSAS